MRSADAAPEDPIREMGVGYPLRRAFMALHRRLKAAIAPLGITPDQYVVLWVLNAYGDQTQRGIHERIHSDGNTLVAVLRRMERRGWVRRGTDPSDGRAQRVRITRAGQSMRRRVFAVARRFHRKALASFGASERDALFDALDRLYRSLQQNGRTP